MRKPETVGVVALLVVLTVVTTLWRQAVTAQLRSEAQSLVVQGMQTALESYPTGALAWAIKSLEIADTKGGRLLALQALWKGPPAWQVNDYAGLTAQFSADGRMLLQTTRRTNTGSLLNMIRANGSSAVIEGGHDTERAAAYWSPADPDLILSVAPHPDGIEYGLWSAGQRRNLGLAVLPPAQELAHWNAALAGVVQVNGDGAVVVATFDGEPARVLGTVPGGQLIATTTDATWFGQVVDGRVETVTIGIDGVGRPYAIGRHRDATAIAVSAGSGRAATRDDSGEIRIWDAAEPNSTHRNMEPLRVFGPAGLATELQFSAEGSLLSFFQRDPDRAGEDGALWAVALMGGPPRLRRLGAHSGDDLAILDGTQWQAAVSAHGSLVWHRLAGPDGTRGLTLQSGMNRKVVGPSFHPQGEWIAGVQNRLTVWSLARPYPMVIPVPGAHGVFGPEGNDFTAISQAADGVAGIYSWPLEGAVPDARRLISERSGQMEMSPDGSMFALGGRTGDRTSPLLVRRDDASERLLVDGFADQMSASAFSPDGKLLTGVGGQFAQEENVIKVWDLDSGELVAEHDPDGLLWHLDLTFTGNRQILWAGEHGTYLWDLDLDEHQLIDSREFIHVSVDGGGRRLVGQETKTGALFSRDFTTGLTTELTAFGREVWVFTLSPDGEILATLDLDGLVRVGSPTNAEPHLLYSHAGKPTSIAIDPRGRWVATTSDEEIRLWPMPDLSQPPLHTLPYKELLARLRSLTNIRLVEDPDAPEGWRFTFESFPGWSSTPLW